MYILQRLLAGYVYMYLLWCYVRLRAVHRWPRQLLLGIEARYETVFPMSSDFLALKERKANVHTCIYVFVCFFDTYKKI